MTQDLIRPVRLPLFVALLMLVCADWPAQAHGELDVQIAAATQRIDVEPGNALLYLKRAELHRAHADYSAALADLDRATLLDPGLSLVDLARGRTLFDTGDFVGARAALDRLLKSSSDHEIALWHRARTLAALELRELAEADFKRVMEISRNPSPDQVIARVENLQADERWAAALEVIEDGLRRTGPVLALQLLAVDLELKLQQHDAALARLNRLIESSPRKESLLVRKGSILDQLGDLDGAAEAYRRADAAISRLPETIQKTQTVTDLKLQIDSHLKPR